MNKKVVEFLNTGKKEYDEVGFVNTVAICSLPINGGESASLYNKIEDFIDYEFNKDRTTSSMLYVKDLSYNGLFILDYLKKSEYEYTQDRSITKVGQYSVVMSAGDIYHIKLLASLHPKIYINMYDIDKIVPLKIPAMNSGFGLDILSYDETDITSNENMVRLTHNASEYVSLMKYMIDMDLHGITLSSRAFSKLKASTKRYKYMYNKTNDEEYDLIHSAYTAGYNDINDEYVGKELGDVLSIDVNSMFPSILRNALLPWGDGFYYEGKYEYEKNKPLYIQRIRVGFASLRDGKVAMTNPYKGGMANHKKYFDELYVSTEITMSNIQLELFLENYVVGGLEYIDGYKYRAISGSFEDFVDEWMTIKVNADREGNEAMRTIAKMVMNYSYGGFGKRRDRFSTYLDKDGKSVTKKVKLRNRYMPVAIFITSYAVDEMVRLIQDVGDRFVYCDTDSLHLIGHDIPEALEGRIHQDKLGYWAIDGKFDRAKFLKLKTYIEQNDEETVVKTAGAGNEIKEQITFENFDYGKTYQGLLRAVRVPGGAIRQTHEYKL